METSVKETIKKLHKRKTLLIIAHRLGTIEGCDTAYCVGDGKITREK